MPPRSFYKAEREDVQYRRSFFNAKICIEESFLNLRLKKSHPHMKPNHDDIFYNLVTGNLIITMKLWLLPVASSLGRFYNYDLYSLVFRLRYGRRS